MSTEPPPTEPTVYDRPDTGPAHPAGFELREVIGRGGMGVVYRGRDRTLNSKPRRANAQTLTSASDDR